MSSCVCCRLFICVYLCWLVIVQSTTVLQVIFVQVALLASATAPCVSSLASGSSFLVQSYIWQTHRTAHNSSLFTTDIGMLHRSAWVWCNSLLWNTNSIVRYLWRALVSHGQTQLLPDCVHFSCCSPILSACDHHMHAVQSILSTKVTPKHPITIMRVHTHTHTHIHTPKTISLHVGGSGDCTVNLINRGIVVREDMASIEFAGNGDASSHTCQIDRQQRRQCKYSVNSWL